MPVGPGKYGARAEALMQEVGGALVIVITIGGDKGAAFDVATTDPHLLRGLPEILRNTAAGLEQDIEATIRAYTR